jgi:hypothetical protein
MALPPGAIGWRYAREVSMGRKQCKERFCELFQEQLEHSVGARPSPPLLKQHRKVQKLSQKLKMPSLFFSSR